MTVSGGTLVAPARCWPTRAAVLALAEELWTAGTPAALVEFNGELERLRSHAPHAHGPNGRWH